MVVMTPSRTLRPITSRLGALSFVALLSVGLLTGACGSDDASSSDATSSCKDICTAAAFTSSRVDVQPNEINCFCSGGTGTVTDAICKDGCTKQGKAKSQPFKTPAAASMDACQCE